MKSTILTKVTAAVMAGIMTFTGIAGTALTAEASTEGSSSGTGKYVSDVFIAYGEEEEDAVQWLRDNGWEPVPGDFNAGKASAFDDDVAAVMGIRRTNNAEDAITDMAVMNMTGGYSIPDYESLVKEKKAEIDEFINVFMPVIREYRANYNGEGSEFGKQRADEAYRLLNLFYDGDPDDDYAVNDTGMHLGDLFLQPLRQEGNESGGDLQQIILESSGPAMLVVETLLAYAADPGEETWLERLAKLSGEGLAENIGEYVPEVAGQNLAASAITALLSQKFGDAADILAEQWDDIHEAMVWYEAYNDEHDLWQHDDESDEVFEERCTQYFEGLGEDDEDAEKYMRNAILYDGLYRSDYEGEWGETLGDFFYPYEDDYSTRPDLFLPMAAALSAGQRAALELISLRQLFYIGLGTEEGLNDARGNLDEIIGDAIEVSIYNGINRGIFRGGVAVTSRALMEENMGRGSAFDEVWGNNDNVAWISILSGVTGAILMGVGFSMCRSLGSPEYMGELVVDNMQNFSSAGSTEGLAASADDAVSLNDAMIMEDYAPAEYSSLRTIGRWMMGIGAALILAAAIVRAVQLYKYYQRDFTPIPRMIVDESDIVTYLKDENGNNILDENGMPKKNIEFNQYEYYNAVRCNRRQVGKISDWQDGVDEYDEKGCGDIADLNVDQGQEWLALYTVKSPNKGNPILADSLTLQYGSDTMPTGCTIGLHFFTYTFAMDLGDTAYSFNNKKGGVYFFWDGDANAYAAASQTASAFSAGYIALAAVAGLLIGILGTTLVLKSKKKRTAPVHMKHI